MELSGKYKAEINREADLVRDVGGLYIIGTERHESRRIDNQLRGRAGRQGDPGETRFFISLEDDLMRLFGGERIQNMMNTLGVEDDMPIENKLLTNSIESAQRKVESRNFATRKNVLQFDDVMNMQREIIYKQRAQVLDGEDISDKIRKMVDDTISSNVDTYIAGEVHDDWNITGLREYYNGWITTDQDLHYDTEELARLEKEDIKHFLLDRAHEIYARREELFTPPIMREIERIILLRNVDSKWMDHIDAMDELKRGIYLRSYGQKDPVVEYRIEGSDMFDQMVASIQEDTVKAMFIVQLKQNEQPKREQVAKPIEASHGATAARPEAGAPWPEVGRNDPVPAEAVKKYKKCCGQLNSITA